MFALPYAVKLCSVVILFHAELFYFITNRLFMCKSPDILRHSRSFFLTTPNLYVQIRELGTKRQSQLRKTWSISRNSRSSCSEARVVPGHPPCPGVSSFVTGAPRLRSRSSDQPSSCQRIFVLPQYLPEHLRETSVVLSCIVFSSCLNINLVLR